MIESVLRSLGTSLLLTLVIELLLALILGVQEGRDFLLIFLVNVITNPLIGILLDVYYVYVAVPPFWLIAVLEAGVVFGEWALYRGRLEYRKLPPFVFSLVLNTASYLIGLGLSHAGLV
ncbi:MAG: hypothetical protein MJ085_00950 [Clostridia bacterium]|nr:hypothetical protein [Clostridia bacterium]